MIKLTSLLDYYRDQVLYYGEMPKNRADMVEFIDSLIGVVKDAVKDNGDTDYNEGVSDVITCVLQNSDLKTRGQMIEAAQNLKLTGD